MAVTAATLSGGDETPPEVSWGGEAPVHDGTAVLNALAIAQQAACVALTFKTCIANNIFDCPYASAASAPLSILIGQAAKLFAAQQPGDLQEADRQLEPQVIICIQDRGGNTVPTAEETIGVAIECRTTFAAVSSSSSSSSPSCSFLSDFVDSEGQFVLQRPAAPVLPVLRGRTSAVSKDGQLLFTDLRVARSGGAYRLRFARVSGSLDEVPTGYFRVLSGTPERMHVLRQAGVSPFAGDTLQPQPIVLVLDKGGNVATQEPAEPRLIYVQLLQHGYEVEDIACAPQQQPVCVRRTRVIGAPLVTCKGMSYLVGEAEEADDTSCPGGNDRLLLSCCTRC